MASRRNPIHVFPLHPTDDLYLSFEPYLLEFFTNKSYCSLKLDWEVPIIQAARFRGLGPAYPRSIEMIYNPDTYDRQHFGIDVNETVIIESSNYQISELPENTQKFRAVRQYCRLEGPPGRRIKRVIQFVPGGIHETRILGTSINFCYLPLPINARREEFSGYRADNTEQNDTKDFKPFVKKEREY